MTTIKAAVPGAVLLPAQELNWKKVTDPLVVSLPSKGSIKALLLGSNLPTGVSIPGEDSFCLLEEGVFRFTEMVRVMFALAKYPKLGSNQCFIIFGVEDDGPDKVLVHGQIVEAVEVEEVEAVE